MRRFHVYIAKASLDRSAPLYKKGTCCVDLALDERVLSTSRVAAIEKLLPKIKPLLEGIKDPTIHYVSVYAGQAGSVTGSAERLVPIQLVVPTGDFRRRMK